MKDWFTRYHAYILSRGEQGRHSVKVYALVWLAPVLVAALIAFAFHLDGAAKLAVVLPAAAVALAGVAFVGVAYMKGHVRKAQRIAELRAEAEAGKKPS